MEWWMLLNAISTSGDMSFTLTISLPHTSYWETWVTRVCEQQELFKRIGLVVLQSWWLVPRKWRRRGAILTFGVTVTSTSASRWQLYRPRGKQSPKPRADLWSQASHQGCSDRHCQTALPHPWVQHRHGWCWLDGPALGCLPPHHPR